MIRVGLVALALASAGPALADPPEPLAPADRTAASSLVGRRLALVVGTTNYQTVRSWPRLPNALTDAKALGDELDARYGFAVTRLEDPSMAAFKSALRKLADEAGPADDLLVFVAGHGHFDAEDRAGYLVFSDGAPSCTTGCYPLDNVKRALYDTRARHVLVMLDACHAGTFEIRTALDSGVAREGLLDVPLKQSLRDYARYPSRLLLASVGAAATTDGAPGTHSPFMRAVLRELAQPGPSGVISLDHLYVALSERESLPVTRPSTFGAAVPAHPGGTFLFIEEVGLCDALDALLAAGDDGFSGVRQGTAERTPWADVTPATWTLPGARRCEVWQWHTGAPPEVRCDLGPWDRTTAGGEARETFRELRQCVGDERTDPRSDDDERSGYAALVLALPARAREVLVSSLCADETCTLSVVVR